MSIKTYHTKFPANQVTLTRANNLELVGMWIQPKKKLSSGVYLTNCAETLDIGPLCLTTEAITNEKKKASPMNYKGQFAELQDQMLCRNQHFNTI